MKQDHTTINSPLLKELLQNPASPSYAAVDYLKQLVTDDPQSGLLKALYASIVNRDELKTAGLYFNSTALYKLAHMPGSLPQVNEDQIITPVADAPAQTQVETAPTETDNEVSALSERPQVNEVQPETVTAEATPEIIDEESQPEEITAPAVEPVDDVASTELLAAAQTEDTPAAVTDELISQADDVAFVEEPAAIEEPSQENDSEIEEIDAALNPEISQETASDHLITEEMSPRTVTVTLEVVENQSVYPEPTVTESFSDGDDEIYEEIVGIEDINFMPINKLLVAEVAPVTAEVVLSTDDSKEALANAPEQNAETQPVAALAEEETEAAADQPDEQLVAATADTEDTQDTIEEVILPEPEASAQPLDLPEAGPTDEEEEQDEAEYAGAIADQADVVSPDAQELESDTPSEVSPETEVEETKEISEPLADLQPEQEPAPAVAEAPKTKDVTEKLIIENIAATDYFVFDRTFRDRAQANTPAPVVEQPASPAKPEQPEEPKPVTVEEQPSIDETSDVSKYHDEKMPYSFMWWLDKTRREHAGVYQPYIKPQQTEQPEQAEQSNPSVPQQLTTPEAHLHQQYIENIFHHSPVHDFETNAPKTIEFDMRSKESKIIERFIKEEPQIKPPSSDKLGNENKAKRSAEDHDELITETLARIYTDQMLYAKAIATYKKLMLKYPEKSSYFAGQITALQKKTS